MASKRKVAHRTQISSVKAPQELDSADVRKAQRVFVGAFLLLAVLRFIAAFFPKERLWGLNLLAYLPMWLTVLLTAVALLSCTPVAARFTRDLTTRLYQFYSWLTTKISRTILYILLSLGFALLCWLFPIQFPFLGDGPQSLVYIARALIGDETSPTSITRVESLTSLVYLNLSKLTPATTDIRTASLYVELVYRIVGAVLGGMFFLLVLTIVHRATRQVSEKVTVIVTLLSCAGTLFFFTYIEYYAFVYVSIGFYCYTALAYYQGRVSISVPIVAFLLSVGFHFLSLVLLPSLLYLLLSHWFTKVRQMVFRRAVLFIGISAVFLFVIYLIIEPLPAARPFFIPLMRDGEQTYSLLSHYRVVDLLNEQFLVSQIGLIFLVVAVLFLRNRIEWSQRGYIFLLFSSSYMVMLNLSGQTAFGMGIDWDIFAAVGLVYTLLGIYLVLPVLQKSQWRWNVASMTIGSIGMSLLPWIVVNVNSDMAVERFENLIDLDAAHLKVWNMEYRYETVRKYYQHEKREAEEFEAIQKLIARTRGDPREYHKLLMFVGERGLTKYRGQFLSALDSLSYAVEESKQAHGVRTDTLFLSEKLRPLCDVYARFLIMGAQFYRLDIQRQGEQLRASFPQLPQGYEILGWYYLLKEDYNVALGNFQQSYGIDTLRYNTLVGLGKIFYHLGEQAGQARESQTCASKALYFYEKALAFQPQPSILIDGDIGYLYLLLGQSANARKYFEWYLQLDNTSEYAGGIKQELSKLR